MFRQLLLRASSEDKDLMASHDDLQLDVSLIERKAYPLSLLKYSLFLFTVDFRIFLMAN